MRVISGSPGASLIAVAIGLVAVGAIAGPASPASAAAGGVEVSPDGVTYGSAYPGSLFDATARLVPEDTMQEVFYVRNSGTEAGFLRITLRDVVASDADFADALTVSASTVGQAGSAATISGANPCLVLAEGQVIAPGQSVRVTTTLMLGNLDGQAGQGATAAFGMRIALSSTAASLPPTDCGPEAGSDITVIPQQPSSPSGSAPGAGAAVPPSSVEPPEEDLPVLGLPGILGIDPNTWRLFEEYLVLILIGSFLLGTAWFAFVAWRRRQTEADQESDQEGAVG